VARATSAKNRVKYGYENPNFLGCSCFVKGDISSCNIIYNPKDLERAVLQAPKDNCRAA
jgi:hypothetical protein